MRFALLGDHPNGVAMARALIESGRHQLIAYSGFQDGLEPLGNLGLDLKPNADIEEILADPAVEMVIVASRPSSRPEQLRRALQAERHVLCVHPADQTPDIAYEAAMIQGDTRKVLMPLLPSALHPGVAWLAQLIENNQQPIGVIQVVQLEVSFNSASAPEQKKSAFKLTFPGWDMLRRLKGEIAEVTGSSALEEPGPNDPVFLTGRFANGGMFQIQRLASSPPRSSPCEGGDLGKWRLAVVGTTGHAEMVGLPGFIGSSSLTWQGGAQQETQTSTWESWNPWPEMVTVFERGLDTPRSAGPGDPPDPPMPSPTWQDAIRCLELDDAARRSIAKRRAVVMEYQEVSEEVGFKGTMTLVGCGLLWVMVILLVLSVPYPSLGLLAVVVLLIFLGLQALRWMIR